jgi:hypothetical protein
VFAGSSPITFTSPKVGNFFARQFGQRVVVGEFLENGTCTKCIPKFAGIFAKKSVGLPIRRTSAAS